MHICCVESPDMFYRFDNALFSSCVGVLMPLLVADLYHAFNSEDRSIMHFLPETLQTLQRLLPVLLRRIPRVLKLVSRQQDTDHRDMLVEEDHFSASSPIHSRHLRARWSAINRVRKATRSTEPNQSARFECVFAHQSKSQSNSNSVPFVRRDCIPVHGHWLQHLFDALVALAGRMVYSQLVLQSSDSPHDGQPTAVAHTRDEHTCTHTRDEHICTHTHTHTDTHAHTCARTSRHIFIAVSFPFSCRLSNYPWLSRRITTLILTLITPHLTPTNQGAATSWLMDPMFQEPFNEQVSEIGSMRGRDWVDEGPFASTKHVAF